MGIMRRIIRAEQNLLIRQAGIFGRIKTRLQARPKTPSEENRRIQQIRRGLIPEQPRLQARPETPGEQNRRIQQIEKRLILELPEPQATKRTLLARTISKIRTAKTLRENSKRIKQTKRGLLTEQPQTTKRTLLARTISKIRTAKTLRENSPRIKQIRRGLIPEQPGQQTINKNAEKRMALGTVTLQEKKRIEQIRRSVLIAHRMRTWSPKGRAKKIRPFGIRTHYIKGGQAIRIPEPEKSPESLVQTTRWARKQLAKRGARLKILKRYGKSLPENLARKLAKIEQNKAMLPHEKQAETIATLEKALFKRKNREYIKAIEEAIIQTERIG